MPAAERPLATLIAYDPSAPPKIAVLPLAQTTLGVVPSFQTILPGVVSHVPFPAVTPVPSPGTVSQVKFAASAERTAVSTAAGVVSRGRRDFISGWLCEGEKPVGGRKRIGFLLLRY